MSRFVSCIALALLAMSAPAQTELKWKWRAGDTFYVQTVTKVKQTLVIEDPRGDVVKAPWSARGAACIAALSGGQPLPVSLTLVPRHTDRDREIQQNYEHSSLVRYTVQKRNDDGSAVLVQRVERDRSAVKGPESSKPDPTLEDAELTLHVNMRGQVTKVEGADKLLVLLAGDDTAKREALREMLDPETLRIAATQTLGLFPKESLKTGESWNSTAELKLGVAGRVKSEREFTLDAVENRGATSLARVSFTTKVSDYQPAKGGNLAFQVAAGYLTQASGKGSLEVDLDAGRLLRGESSVKLAGYLTLRNSDVFYRVRLAQEQTVTTRVTDKLPPKEEAKK